MKENKRLERQTNAEMHIQYTKGLTLIIYEKKCWHISNLNLLNVIRVFS